VQTRLLMPQTREGVRRAPTRALFDDGRAVAVIATKEAAPELVREAGRLRSLSFAGRSAATTADFGLDAHDDYYEQLLVLDKETGAMIAGTRLGPGAWILEDRGWEALYSARYWRFREGMVQVARCGVEVGRTWVNPVYRRQFRGLGLLWKALALYLEEREATSLFGVVSLTGYPPESEAGIANYLWRYHRTEPALVEARQPVPLRGYGGYASRQEGVPAGRALRELTAELNRTSPEHPVPVLLRHYARFGAELCGPFAADPPGRPDSREDKVAALLMASAGKLRASIERFKAL
jgi:hypothetical protein